MRPVIETGVQGALDQQGTQPGAIYEQIAGDSLAALELVLAQPAISSQLIDNLNASIHLRALLTDLFLVGDILTTQHKPGQIVTS